MPLISIHDVEVNSVLAEPILDREGRTILAEGTPLTPVILRRLELWSVPRVTVETRVAVEPRNHASADDGSQIEATPLENATLPAARPWAHPFAPHRDNPQMALVERALDRWAATREGGAS